jgi:hypothetical protein
MQPDGTFILEYANKHNLKAILRYGLRRQAWSPFTLDPVEFARLNFDFHPRAVRAWLEQSNFALERQLSVSHFRIRLLKRWIPLKLLVAMDSAAQLTGNLWQLSPSIFTRSRAVGDTPLAEPGAFFRCPNCNHDPLEQAPQELICPNCSRHWPIQDGIYDFRV